MGAESLVSSLPGAGTAGAMLDLLPTGVSLVELGTARVLYANRKAHMLAGGELPLSDGPGDYSRLYPCTDAEGRPVSSDDMPGPRIARREPFTGVRLDWATPEGVRTVLVSGQLTELPDGTEVGVVTFEDVTSLEKERRRARLLANAAARLADSLDLAETLAAVAAVTLPAVADWCFVEMCCADGSIKRVLVEHRDPDKRAFIEEYDRRYPLDPDAPIGSAAVIRTGRPELVTDITDELLTAVATDPEQLRLLQGAGFRSSVIVPLRVRGVVIGDLALATAESGRRYEEADVPVVQELADRCAMAIDNARLHGELMDAGTAARDAQSRAEAMLAGVADAVTAQAADGTVVYANPAALERLGYPSIDALAAAPPAELRERFAFTDEDGVPLPIERLPGRRALAGEDPEPLIVRHRSVHDGELRWARVQANCVRSDDGRPLLAINVIEDVTDIKRAEEGYRFLAEASRVLSGSLDYEATLRAVADLAVPRIGDWCAVDIAGPDGLDRVAVAHIDPARVALARQLQDRYPPEPDSPVFQVIATGRSTVFREIPDAMLVAAARDEEHLRIVREVGMRSAMVVPMTLRDRVLGTISFVSAESERRFDDRDLAVAEDLALRAAVAIDNARLYATSAAIARTLQDSLLPPHLPELAGMELAALYRPAGEGFDVGGDFYDVFSTAEDQWYLVMGDVCGKGAEAAAITALARYTIRAAAVRRRSPSAILRWLNDAMLRQNTDGRFCTIACAHLDLSRETPRLAVACGGHPAPLVLRADGHVEELGTPGTLLGLLEEPELQDRITELQPGDAMVAYTDGLTDAAAPGRTWSPGELAAVLARCHGRDARDLLAGLAAAALDGVAQPRDDVALLALRVER